MGYLTHLKDILSVASILSLLFVGVLITLKSGMVTVGGDQCRVVMGNLSQLIITLAGCLVFLMVLQEIVGFHMGW
jgi:hypothetical protein